MNILIIHTAFIGDIALSTPFVRAVSDKYPDADLYYLTTPAGAALLQNNPLIKEIIVFDKKVGYVVEVEPQNIADALVDFYTNNRSTMMIENIKIEKQKFTWSHMTEAIDGLF